MPKTIKLSQPKTFGDVTISEITLRDPTYGELFEIGPPATFVVVREAGGGFEQVAESVVKVWIERLADVDPNYLPSLHWEDGIALREAVLDFFRAAMARLPQ
jgi:hypothetical protein